LHSRLVSEELTVRLLRSMSDLPGMLAELGIARADAARLAAALRAPATSPTAVAPDQTPPPPPPPSLPLHALGRVPAAVYINLASRTDRRRAMEAALPAVGLGHAERFEALTTAPPSVISISWDTTLNARFDRNCPPNTALRMSAGEIGCAASHVALWRRCAASEAPLLILEDDVSFGTPEVDASCRALMRAVEGASELPAERLVVLYLGAEATVRESAPSLRAKVWIWAGRATSVTSELLEVTWAWQTHAYLLWPAAARVLLAGLPVDAPVDVYLSRHFHEGKLCGLVARPHLAKQHDPYRGGDVEHSSLQDRARMGLSNRLAAETAAGLR
jgi:GR25 family glycosyltransferase involved in LPS biosynthesis